MGNCCFGKVCVKCDCPLHYYKDDVEVRPIRTSCREHRMSRGMCKDCGIDKTMGGNCNHVWKTVWC